MAVALLFRALGDPTRLEMVRRLASGDEYTITSVSAGLDITRQGARKHLGILAEADLVRLVSQGRDTKVELDRDTLDQARMFIAHLEQQWDKRLDALRQFVDED